MLKKITFALVGLLILGYFSASRAQDDVKVVPIGETIKPEAGSGTGGAKKKKVARPAVVKEGTSFLVELGTALSSGLTQVGDTVYIYAVEDVGSRGKAAITMGARGTGKVTQVDKKAKTLSVSFEEMDGTSGAPVGVGGSIQLQGEKDQAAAGVGERFTATVDEKVVIKPKPRKKGKEVPEEILTGFVEIEGKGAKVDIKKGKAGGKVKMILEAPKGFTSDDIQVDTVALSQVNTHPLEEGVRPTAQDPKSGDANKNGTTDWAMYFGAWDFVRNQPEGTNTVYIRGNLKSGKAFQATTRVTIGY